jgi:hypothetical protein
MTVINPPVWLNDADVQYTADDQRRFIEAMLGGRAGIVYPGDLAPTQRPTPDMQVRIADGRAFIANSLSTVGGTYLVDNQGFTDVALDAADTSPRYDRIIAEVRDEQYAGTSNDWRLHVVKGTPAGTPSEPSLAAFNNYIEIARVFVGANVTSITNANIVDRRVFSTKGQAAALGGTIVTQSGSMPTTNLFEGVRVLQTDTNREMVHTGALWAGAGAYAAPPIFYQNFGALEATSGGGFVTPLSVASALVAPYPVRAHIEVHGTVGFGSSAVRTLMRIVDFGVTVIYSSVGGAGYIGGVSSGEMAVDSPAASLIPFYIDGTADFAAGAAVSCKFQHAVTSGTNSWCAGRVKITFEPRIS